MNESELLLKIKEKTDVINNNINIFITNRECFGGSKKRVFIAISFSSNINSEELFNSLMSLSKEVGFENLELKSSSQIFEDGQRDRSELVELSVDICVNF